MSTHDEDPTVEGQEPIPAGDPTPDIYAGLESPSYPGLESPTYPGLESPSLGESNSVTDSPSVATGSELPWTHVPNRRPEPEAWSHAQETQTPENQVPAANWGETPVYQPPVMEGPAPGTPYHYTSATYAEGQAMARKSANGTAITGIILGGLGIPCPCIPFGIMGAIFSWIAYNNAKELSPMATPTLPIAGLVLSIVSTLMFLGTYISMFVSG